MAADPPVGGKKKVLEQLLEEGMVLVAMDARAEGVDVPQHLRHDPQLRLNVSYRFGLPIDIKAWGIHATLTFAGEPYQCKFPWHAIFLMVSHVTGQPYLFPDDIPVELLTQSDTQDTNQLINAASHMIQNKLSKKEKPKLTVVSSDRQSAEPQQDKPTQPTTPTDQSKRRHHLRLVK